MVTAVVSFFVGALALATSTYNVYLQRQQVRAQVWPRLAIAADLNNGSFTVALANRGVGPAEIRRLRVTVDGKAASDWFDVERRLLGRDDFDMMNVLIGAIEGQVVSPGQELTTLGVHNVGDARALFFALDRLGMELCYCSTLGECWIESQPSAIEPTRTYAVPECAPDPAPFRAATRASYAALQKHVADVLKDAGGRD
jgi:hypothetical protein